jgi:hypothetical protein
MFWLLAFGAIPALQLGSRTPSSHLHRLCPVRTRSIGLALWLSPKNGKSYPVTAAQLPPTFTEFLPSARYSSTSASTRKELSRQYGTPLDGASVLFALGLIQFDGHLGGGRVVLIAVVELVLEVRRGLEAECAVAPHAVVVGLAVVEEVGLGLGAGAVAAGSARRG